MNLEDIDHEDGSDNTAGIGQDIWVAKLADIATLPTPQLDDSAGTGNFSQLVTISDNIVMKSGKVFNKIRVTLETSALNGDIQGNMDGKSFKNAISGQIPGNKAKALGFLQWAKNSSLIAIIEELDGQVRILGHRAYPAKLTAGSANTGAKTTDDRAVKFTLESVRKGPAPVFTGKVVLTGGAVGSGSFDANNNTYQDIEFVSGS